MAAMIKNLAIYALIIKKLMGLKFKYYNNRVSLKMASSKIDSSLNCLYHDKLPGNFLELFNPLSLADRQKISRGKTLRDQFWQDSCHSHDPRLTKEEEEARRLYDDLLNKARKKTIEEIQRDLKL
jgi:hypothetical protein